jgi:hypothetical protein
MSDHELNFILRDVWGKFSKCDFGYGSLCCDFILKIKYLIIRLVLIITIQLRVVIILEN